MTATVVLTGGATGIGAATLTRLLARGAQVHVLDVVAPDVQSVRYQACDLGDPASITAAVARLPQRIDALVNVAGIATAKAPEDVLAINFLGMRALTQALLPRVVDGGSVVIVASSAGRDWQKREDVVKALLDTADFASGLAWLRAHRDVWRDNPYKFSKQVAAAYTYRAAGLELRRRVRVNCVNPGSTGTQLTTQFREIVGAALYDWGVDQIGRQGTPDDIAEVIDYLALGECRWLNGVEIAVDGGYIAGIVGGWVDVERAPEGPEPRPA